MTIEPSEMLEPVEGGLPVAKIRAGLKGVTESVDGQRIEAWCRLMMAPVDEREDARKRYAAICREEARLLEAVAAWNQAHPEGEG